MKELPEFDFDNAIVVFKRFCNFFEAYPLEDERSFFHELRKYLLEIYSIGLQLPPSVDLSDIKYAEISLEDIKPRLMAMDGLISHRFYWEVFDPYDDNDTNAVCGDIIDDIGDIYKDIKNATLIYDTELEGHKQDALWKLEFGFKHHWGDHCVDALRACHNVLRRLN